MSTISTSAPPQPLVAASSEADRVPAPPREAAHVLPLASAPAEARFDLLHGALVRYHTGLTDSGLKVTASLVVVIGWLITSDGAARLFFENQSARWLGTVGVLLAATVYGATTVLAQRASKRVSDQLGALNYMPPDYYADRVLRTPVVWIYVASNVLLNAFAGSLMWLIKPGP